MRKSRKVIADVTASPPPQPTQPEATSKPDLPCYRCGQGRAKELLVMGQRIIFPAFCSPACAVDHALQDVRSAFYGRCQEHNRWRNSFGKCALCEERFADATNLGNVQPAAAQVVEGEVSNEQ